MCHSIPAVRFLHQAIPNNCTAKTLGAGERLTIGVQAIARNQTITEVANQANVSRKFVYQQAAIAQTALDDAFASPTGDDKVLFNIPVTKAWLRQSVLALTLICHSSYRGVVEFHRDIFNSPISVGTVHNIVHQATAQAEIYNQTQILTHVRIAGLDEIFQNQRPVLVGADIDSTYCFLLSEEDHRDADTWGIRLLELAERDFAPEATIADFAPAIRAGQELAQMDAARRGDVFHAVYEIGKVVTILENHAYTAIDTHAKLLHKKAKLQRQARSAQRGKVQELGRQVAKAAKAVAQAVALADDIALLARWLQFDVLAVSGLAYADRVALYDFVVAEVRARQSLSPKQIGPISTLLKNQRESLLAFAAQLDNDLTALAKQFHVAVDTVRSMLDLLAMNPTQPRRWQQEAVLRSQLGEQFWALAEAVQEVADAVVRASSVVENINSRLRSYFFLRRQLGSDYLNLLQFFLNHRRFLRSEHAERKDKSPAELLTGEKHPHWLEMLGYRLFTR